MSEHATGLGTVTRAMVRVRAIELAIIGGRSALDVAKSDWEEAKRELTGEPGVGATQTLLESVTDSERWDPVAGSTGNQVPAAPSDDEDAEGRSDNERLVEAGIAEAEHDLMLQATKAAAKKDL